MQFLNLSPWTQLTASVISCLLAILYQPISNPTVAYAADPNTVASADETRVSQLDFLGRLNGFEGLHLDLDEEGQTYEPNFAQLDRSIIGRAATEFKPLENNVPGKGDIKEGETQYWRFSKKALSEPQSPTNSPLPFELNLRDLVHIPLPDNEDIDDDISNLLRRQADTAGERTVYVTLSICDQPSLKETGLVGETRSPLSLFISKSPDNEKPNSQSNDFAVSLDGGYGAREFSASNDVFLAVTATKNSQLSGIINYELTASIDAPYTTYNDHERPPGDKSKDYLFHIDSDTSSALLISNELTMENSSSTEYKHRMSNPPPYSIFVHNQDDPLILNVGRSICWLKTHAQIKGNLLSKKSSADFMTSMVTSGGGQPRQQFFVSGLNASSTYYAILAVDGNSTKAGDGVVKGGGTVGRPKRFRTKSGLSSFLIRKSSGFNLLSSDNTCALIHGLSFCSDVAYAVPSNASNTVSSNSSSLASLYDNNVRNMYRNFTFALQQTPCNTTSSARYSLARTCDDCEAAYKAWLCAVSIPRCEDFGSQEKHLQPRSVALPFVNGTYAADPSLNDVTKNGSFMNTARSPFITNVIKPGPWKEVLPCKDLCYELVRSCPATLGFACPLEGEGLESYGSRKVGNDTMCNHPGKPWFINGASTTIMDRVAMLSAFGIALLLLWKG